MKPIQLYSLNTPNGQKISIALEELGLPYDYHRVDIGAGDQFTPEFLAINPNNKIPAITDPDGPDGEPINVFESGAILLHLAEKTGKLLPADPGARSEAIQWLFWQVAGLGPMFGQLGHFYKWNRDKCDHPYPIERFAAESQRILGVLDKRLEGRSYLVGEEYSIADIATFPWVDCLVDVYGAGELVGVDQFKNVATWRARCNDRPAVNRSKALYV